MNRSTLKRQAATPPLENRDGESHYFTRARAVQYNRGIHGNIFKLRISGFQALATPAAYKSCRNHRRGPGSWKEFFRICGEDTRLL